jgi:NAD(P)-dependent dehydrogenase (short-subunit alcohol dehydrogenase family)
MSGVASSSWSRILLDKVVFITGGGGGIGSAIARTCAAQGARVVVSDVDKKASDRVVAQMIAEDEEKKDRLLSLELDTVSEEAIEQAVKQVVSQWKTVDVLVNA